MNYGKSPGKSFWICGGITLLSALVSAGFSLAGLFGDGKHDAFAMYAAARSVSLPVAVLCCLLLRSRAGIAGLALAMALVQAFDGVIGFLTHEPAKTYGPLVFAVATFIALAALGRAMRARKDLQNV